MDMQLKILLLCSLFLVLLPHSSADLRVGFYQSTCPKAESIVLELVQRRFFADPSVVAALLRMHFHDCFVRGCDASILIDSAGKHQAEKDAGPNQTVREFKLIDDIKKALEAACPNTVSCADIIALATRDAVALAQGPNYTVPTGRRDGLFSNMQEVNLPGPSSSVSDSFKIFRDKGLTLNEMVTLLGAHTVGVSHCSFFADRLGSGSSGPSMDPTLASKLNNVCSSSSGDPTVFLDQNTPFVFDNMYYNQLQLKRGILQIDQALASDRSTARIVAGFATNGSGFSKTFSSAIVKMGSIEVLVGNAGQIRRNCRALNIKTTVPRPPPKKKTVPRPKRNRKPKVPPKKKIGG
ncbi:hypothetical protein K2173_026887 [Erythroxylum novogranatense]|uniref:Peroxidase n=1 Tax=Erythroxylum novogranatense TaxID=1862640 RepID=A0AAV8TZY0_9ROSI|nr:hypothetical protein K2173_026887 [Erythroxylum novogranatense]